MHELITLANHSCEFDTLGILSRENYIDNYAPTDCRSICILDRQANLESKFVSIQIINKIIVQEFREENAAPGILQIVMTPNSPEHERIAF